MQFCSFDLFAILNLLLFSSYAIGLELTKNDDLSDNQLTLIVNELFKSEDYVHYIYEFEDAFGELLALNLTKLFSEIFGGIKVDDHKQPEMIKIGIYLKL